MIRNHLDILEQTFVLEKVTPFVGNKRTEVTSNPVYYYLDNGFRNVALRNFSALDGRTDLGLLVESLVFQEIYKFRAQHYLSFDIHYWRTKSGAEVDFVVSKNSEQFAAIEVKYRRLNKPAVTRGFRSFLQAYQPPLAVVMTKNYLGSLEVEGCNVQFIPVDDLPRLLRLLQGLFA
jgi:predicted AAA+ superfamily ATPase